jgi:hypothetical protein
VVIMGMQPEAEASAVGADEEPIEVPWATGLAIGAAAVVTLVVGVFPSILLDWADQALPALTAAVGG